METTTRKKRSFSLFSRPIWRSIHVATGLVCGLVFAVVCGTGCLYLFRDEIARVAEPERYFASENGANRKNLDDLVGDLERDFGARVETVVVPRDRRRTLRFFLRTDGARNRRILCDVDPFSGKVVGTGADKETRFFKAVRRWHTRLNLPARFGCAIVDVCCVVALVLVATGLRLWIPPKRFPLRRRLTVRLRSGGRVLLYDLHNALGFYAAIPLALSIASGVVFAYYGTHADVAPPRAVKTVVEENEAISLESFVLRVLADSRGVGALKLTLPVDSQKSSLRIERTSGGFWSFVVPTVYHFDARNGSLIEKRTFRDLPPKDRFMAIVRGCHYGDLFGLGSKIVFCFSCFAGVVLVVSGVWFELVKDRKVAKKPTRLVDARPRRR